MKMDNWNGTNYDEYYEEYDDYDDYDPDEELDYLEEHYGHQPSFWQRIKNSLKNLYYRWKHPMDDIPF